MEKNVLKIIKLIDIILLFILVVVLVALFIEGLIVCDDDIMFISALCLCVLTCFEVMIAITSYKISKLFTSKKQNKTKKIKE